MKNLLPNLGKTAAKYVNMSGQEKKYELYKACSKGDLWLARLLIQKLHTKFNIYNESGETPLHAASKNGQVEVVEFLLRLCVQIHGQARLYVHVDRKAPDLFREFGVERVDIDAHNVWNYTPLHYAAMLGKSGVLKTLIENDVRINALNIYGETALQLACFYNHTVAAILLIKNGADINFQDIWGYTPLQWSCKRENEEVVKLLLVNGAKVSIKNHWHQTALDIVQKKSQEENKHELIKLLSTYKTEEKVKEENEALDNPDTPSVAIIAAYSPIDHAEIG